jgi:micrococcal nuclease
VRTALKVLFLLFCFAVIVSALLPSEDKPQRAEEKAKQEQPSPEKGSKGESTPTPEAAPQPTKPSKPDYPEPVRGEQIARVIDGDTFELNKPVEGSDTVRLIGIDTPEECQPLGQEAADNLDLLTSYRIRLKFDEDTKDQYGRLLAYVYDDISGEMINERQIADGYAQTYVVPSNDRYADRLERAQQEAKEFSLGSGMDIWSLPKAEDRLLADRGNGIGQGDGACLPEPTTASPTASPSPSPAPASPSPAA